MQIGLVSSMIKDNDVEYRLQQIQHYLSTNERCNLLCFGERFTQGFEGLTWIYKEDINRAIAQDSII